MTARYGLFVLAAAFAAGLFGCADDQLSGTPVKNRPPEVWLSAGPPEGSEGHYEVEISWGGWDPDGEIAYYEFAISDNDGVFDPADTTGADKWRRVFRNDSTFTFTADLLADSTEIGGGELKPVEFRRSHTFFIRAVDDHRLASPEPDYRSFTSKTLSPVVDIIAPTATAPNPARIGPIATFEWLGQDYLLSVDDVQEPDSVRYILVSTEPFGDSFDDAIEYIRENPGAPEWHEWRDYRATDGSGTSWRPDLLDFGTYVLAVQVMDEAGAVSPVYDEQRNVRRILVGHETFGPRVTVTNKYSGTIVAAGPYVPPVIADFPTGLAVSFEFSADASFYGGYVAGYRYGWDGGWDIDWTPFVGSSAMSAPKTMEADMHGFQLEVMDNWGVVTRVLITCNIVPFTMQKNVLFIDDWDENSDGFAQTNGALPSDAEHDAFWESMLDDVEGFDPAVDMIDLKGASDLPINVLADYGTVIWNAAGAYDGTSSSLLNEILHPNDSYGGKLSTNVLALFLAAGGHVLLCGEQVMTASINRDLFYPAFPLIFRYELGGDQDGDYEDSDVGVRGIGEASFAYDDCCLNVLDIAAITSAWSIRRSPTQSCPVSNIRSHNQVTDGLRNAVPIGGDLDFPALGLRPEVADPGKWFAEDRSGLNCDIYNPPYFQDVCGNAAELVPLRDCFQPIYALGCLNLQSVIYGAPVAFWTSRYADKVPDAGGVAARSAVWGFQPVYFNPPEAKQALDVILFEEWNLPRGTP